MQSRQGLTRMRNKRTRFQTTRGQILRGMKWIDIYLKSTYHMRHGSPRIFGFDARHGSTRIPVDADTVRHGQGKLLTQMRPEYTINL